MKNSKKIGVMICTAQRPIMLRKCIESLLNQRIPEHWSVEICVVENDTTPRSKAVVDSFASSHAGMVRYYQEPRRGIPIARNKTIDVALENQYDWIALIDDDEIALPDWIANLIDCAGRYNADVVNGPVQRLYEQQPPEWWRKLKPAATEPGAVLTEAPTNNTFFTSDLIDPAKSNLRFEERLTFGYEDIDFFRRADAVGHKIVWAPEAIVEEEIPASRVTPQRLLSRVQMQATGLTYSTKLRRGFWHAATRFAPKAVRRILWGIVSIVLALPVIVLNRKKGMSRYYTARIRFARGMGNLRGLTKYSPDYYGQIDGS